MKINDPIAVIIAAVIGVFGIVMGVVIGAFLNPFASKLINQPTPTANPTLFPIENFPQQVFAYYGNAEGVGGAANVNLLYDGIHSYPSYHLDYNIPQGQTGYAGMAFQLDNGQNVTSYNAIEFTIQFSDTNIPIDFYVKDITGQSSSMRILSTSTDKMKLRYELDNFKGIDFNAFKEVGLNSDNTFSSGRHIVTISGISFVR
jgi:hypothetical protein